MGFKAGLTFEEVLLYASIDLPWEIMHSMKQRIIEAKKSNQPFVFTDKERELLEQGGDDSLTSGDRIDESELAAD